MNIVRVYHNESPVILDIVETDETLGLGAQAMGGVAAIGAATGRTGSAGGTLTASDAVTNRYIPLQGQALISQLSSQITVETLNALYDSDWPLQSIVEFAIDKLTPTNDDYDLAEDLLTQLDTNYAIALATAKSGFSASAAPKSVERAKGGPITINMQTPSAGGGDTLNIYLDPTHTRSSDERRDNLSKNAWRELSSLYVGTQPDSKGKRPINGTTLPGIIELRNSPRTHLSDLSKRELIKAALGPVMRTRTAIGILKYIVTQPDVAFLTPAEYVYVRSLPWNHADLQRSCGASEFYVLSPDDTPLDRATRQEDEEGLSTYFSKDLRLGSDTVDIKNYLYEIQNNQNQYQKYFGPGDRACAFSYGVLPVVKPASSRASFATDLGFLKRFILIIKSENPLPSAYTTWFSNGLYYSIMDGDIISQRNLMLVSQFLTIQATSTPSPALTTVSATSR